MKRRAVAGIKLACGESASTDPPTGPRPSPSGLWRMRGSASMPRKSAGTSRPPRNSSEWRANASARRGRPVLRRLPSRLTRTEHAVHLPPAISLAGLTPIKMRCGFCGHQAACRQILRPAPSAKPQLSPKDCAPTPACASRSQSSHGAKTRPRCLSAWPTTATARPRKLRKKRSGTITLPRPGISPQKFPNYLISFPFCCRLFG